MKNKNNDTIDTVAYLEYEGEKYILNEISGGMCYIEHPYTFQTYVVSVAYWDKE